MIKFIDLSFHVSGISLKDCIIKYRPSYGYTAFLLNRMNVEVIMHFEQEQHEIVDGVTYTGLKGKNGFFNIPFKTLSYISKQKPDVVLVHGLIYPLQVILLRLVLGKDVIIAIRPHREILPANKLKQIFYKIADSYTNAYLDTSKDNFKEWIDSNLIKHPGNCFEILGGSTDFTKQNKEQSKLMTRMEGDYNFLWVGRLEDKDPFTILGVFEKYIERNSSAKLYMIYQTSELLPALKQFISSHVSLQNAVNFIGEIPHDELPAWYSAADFFILGSHKEATGFALLEAMACGCIPVVTNIPPFRKITGNGKYGILFKPGDADDLLQKLNSIEGMDREHFPNSVVQHFNEQLSFKKIADDIFDVAMKLMNNKNDA